MYNIFAMNQAITITYGDQAENHVGMQILGTAQDTGLNLADIDSIAAKLNELEFKTEIMNLNVLPDTEDARLLIIRGGVNHILHPFGKNADDMYIEQMVLPRDKKARMYGKTVNKKARHNLCFADEKQEPDYDNGKGRIIAWPDIPLTNQIRQFMALLHPKFANLVAEANYYYNPQKCGIGFHGDAERRIVIAARLGVTIPLHYQWYIKHKPIGPRIEVELGHGDIYVMSSKAVGFDWKSSSQPTLRHAAGAPEYLR